MKTREELEQELEKIDNMLQADVLNMATQTALEAYQAALCWALGLREESPSQLEA